MTIHELEIRLSEFDPNLEVVIAFSNLGREYFSGESIKLSESDGRLEIQGADGEEYHL